LDSQCCLDNTTNNRKALDFAEKAVMANAKQIAKVFTPFYGEAATEQLYTLLVKHYDAIKAYSEATVAGSKSRQDAALADYASNTDEIAARDIGREQRIGAHRDEFSDI